jgi:hypothetical protein
MKVFLYPMLDENGDIITSENLKVHPRMNYISSLNLTGRLLI